MQTLPPTVPETRLATALPQIRTISAFLLVAALVSGCNKPPLWDREYACTGQEQSITSFAGDDPAMAIRKTYSQTIDFHLRLPNALVKSRQVVVDATTGDAVSFSAREPSSWMTGHFHLKNAELDVIDEKILTIAGRSQQVRTSGQYTCTASGAGRAT